MTDKLTVRSNFADEFEDISHQQMRHYAYPSGGQIMVEEPVGLFVTEEGGHVIVTQSQVVFHLKPGWDICSWKPKAGMPHVVKSDVEPRPATS